MVRGFTLSYVVDKTLSQGHWRLPLPPVLAFIFIARKIRNFRRLAF